MAPPAAVRVRFTRLAVACALTASLVACGGDPGTRPSHGADTGWDWRSPLQPAQALTIEPGMYLASEGIGLRVEDDYWVGATSLECLSCALPRWPEEIEAVMDAGRASASAVSLAPPSRTLPVSPWSVGRRHMLPRAQPEK